MRRAFTLIELLVVIAIIAILAAILFPVFAQAKVAAKGAASLSNNKQIALGVQMYAADYDDMSPIHNTWDPNAPVLISGCGARLWTYDVLPYIKSGDMFVDPLKGGSTVPAGWPKSLYYAYTSQYGLNYAAWSPMLSSVNVAAGTCAAPWISTPSSLTAAAEIANTVMIGARKAETELGGEFFYGPGTLMTRGGIEPVHCATIDPWCFVNWGVGTMYTSTNFAAGYNTGGVSNRKTDNQNLVFGDGHAKFTSAGNAAAGTTWTKTAADTTVVINDVTKYMWDLL